MWLVLLTPPLTDKSFLKIDCLPQILQIKRQKTLLRNFIDADKMLLVTFKLFLLIISAGSRKTHHLPWRQWWCDITTKHAGGRISLNHHSTFEAMMKELRNAGALLKAAGYITIFSDVIPGYLSKGQPKDQPHSISWYMLSNVVFKTR